MKKNDETLSIIVYGTFAVIIVLCVIFASNLKDILTVRPPEFSKQEMLQALWYQYKLNYLEPGTLRSLDKQRGNVTTSEGQSYTMLRAVWMDDKQTFDAAWQWTKDNLQRKDDHLMSWLFGQRSDGSYGVLTAQGGYNTATDADEDIALALLFASKRWNNDRYYGDAILIIKDIWQKEVETIAGKPYLLANDVEKTAPKSTAILNPSYMSPYAYKEFARADDSHDWLALASSSYEVIGTAMRLSLDRSSTAFIPPDWVTIDKRTGEISAPPASAGLTSNFSYDAMRVPWRLALDWQWSHDPRDKQLLDGMSFFANQWRSTGSLVVSYAHDGSRLSVAESPAIYGGAIGYFIVSDLADADAVYRDKLESLYDPNETKWIAPQGYYDENWAWFGIGLSAGELRDLYDPALYQTEASTTSNASIKP